MTQVETLFDDMPARPKGLRAPFPYSGGKSRVSHLVWHALGDPVTYVEPFFGSGAVLLGRPPSKHKREIANDVDGYVANFWRAVRAAPDEVAKHVEDPVSEIDLQAWHRWLVEHSRKRTLVESMRNDPRYFDAEIAGRWCWGASQWFGRGWCAGEWFGPGDDRSRGDGIVSMKRPDVKLKGILANRLVGKRDDAIKMLSERLRSVSVLCGDWERIVKPCVFVHSTGVFLDPPYAHATGRSRDIYSHEMTDTGAIESWCRANESDPFLRIVLAGFDGEYDLPSWTVVPWRRTAGGVIRGERGVRNLRRERLLLSPNCEVTPVIRQAIEFFERNE